MAWVETRITRTSQPQDAVRIDWTNPITRGLVLASNPMSLRAINSVSQANVGAWVTATFEPGSPVAMAVTRDGLAVNSTHDFADITTNIVDDTSATFLQVFTPSIVDPNGRPWMRRGQDGFGNGWSFQIGQNSSGQIEAGVVLTSGGIAGFGAAGPAISVGNRYVAAAVYDKASTALKCFLGGIKVATTNTGKTVFRSSTKNIILGGTTNPAGSTVNAIGLFGISLAFNRALSDAEVKSLSANPWQIFEPEIVRIWVDDYVSTGGVTQVQSDASLNYVLQAITFQSQGGMYSILGLVNSDINSSYYVNEATVNSSSASYVIQNAVAQSQNEEYNVLASLSNTQGSTYNVRSALSQDQGSTYFISESTYREQLVDYVIRSAQFNDQGGTYNILSANTVGNNASLNYVISALIQQDQQENYLVRSSSHQETNGTYTVRASAENSTEGSYIVRGSLSSEAQLDYTVRAEVNSEGTLSYTIRVSLSKDQGLMYDILAANNVSSSSGGSYIIQATTANNTSCSYQIQGEVIDVPLTNAEMQQLYAWVSELVTKSATKGEIATAVWSKPTSELTVENSIGKWLMQKVLTVSKFLALK